MRKNKKEEIVAATIRLVAQKGVNGSTIREISDAAGVTEGAVYRHFASKEDLCQQVYCSIVAEMAAAKEEILESEQPIDQKIHDWVRVTFEYFDTYQDAFTYVLLTSHDFPDELAEISSRQGRILMKMLDPVCRAEQSLPREVALSHFTGLMLNIPRLINEGFLTGPAMAYTEEVVRAITSIFSVTRKGSSRAGG